jgi:hypothetical protein
LKLWIKIERSIKKYRRGFFFSKLQNGGLNGDGDGKKQWLMAPLFFSFGSHTVISQPNSTYKPILDLL